MFRNVMDGLAAWCESDKQAILVKGARGVGKTWAVKDMAEAFFDRYLLIDFEQETDLLRLFQGTVDAGKIEARLNSRLRKSRSENLIFDERQLLIFDEVQLLRNPLPGIMAYAMQRPNVRICIVASWVGPLEGEDFYDDIDTFTMYPMTFEEFLTANKAQYLCQHIERQKLEVIAPEVKQEIKEFLQAFMITGGMPEVVQDYVQQKNYANTDSILKRQLSEMRSAIRLAVPRALERKVLKVWDSLPTQLTKDNRKFMYGYVDEKARAREYEPAVKWLVSSGFVRQIFRVVDGISPLVEQMDDKSYELFHLDHGLLRCMCDVPVSKVEGDKIYTALKGVITEQYVVEELHLNANVPTTHFWISGATARVDFVFEDDGEVIPVEVQAKVEKRAQNLKVFSKRYNNRMSIRVSLDDLNFSKGILNIPLYGLWNF